MFANFTGMHLAPYGDVTEVSTLEGKFYKSTKLIQSLTCC